MAALCTLNGNDFGRCKRCRCENDYNTLKIHAVILLFLIDVVSQKSASWIAFGLLLSWR